MERDEDLTAPYAFQNKTWIAYEDKISVGIKVRTRISQLFTLCKKYCTELNRTSFGVYLALHRSNNVLVRKKKSAAI